MSDMPGKICIAKRKKKITVITNSSSDVSRERCLVKETIFWNFSTKEPKLCYIVSNTRVVFTFCSALQKSVNFPSSPYRIQPVQFSPVFIEHQSSWLTFKHFSCTRDEGMSSCCSCSLPCGESWKVGIFWRWTSEVQSSNTANTSNRPEKFTWKLKKNPFNSQDMIFLFISKDSKTRWLLKKNNNKKTRHCNTRENNHITIYN